MFAIIKSDYNSQITNRLLDACKKHLKKESYKFEVFEVPGALEIPFIASKLLKEKKYNCIIALGCIIKGDTYHFEIVANESARALMDLSISSSVPIMNGILACYDIDQAEKRAKGFSNKGLECAKSAIIMSNDQLKISNE